MSRYVVHRVVAAVLLGAIVFCAGTVLGAGADQSARLTFTHGSRLLMPIEINGHPVNALLDSAAEATLIDTELAKTLNIGKGRSVAGHGSGENSFDAKLVNGITLEALGITLPDQTVAIADLSDVGRRLLKHRLDAILGREIFDAARLAIDIDAQRIAVVPRDRQPRGLRLDLLSEHGVETVPVLVESGEPVRATFDLGNGSHVLISRAFAERRHLLEDGRKVGEEHGGGLGGDVRRQVLTLKSLDLAGRRFDNVQAAIDPQDTASDVNVGVAILRNFRITTDFAQHAVWLEPLPERR